MIVIARGKEMANNIIERAMAKAIFGQKDAEIITAQEGVPSAPVAYTKAQVPEITEEQVDALVFMKADEIGREFIQWLRKSNLDNPADDEEFAELFSRFKLETNQ